MQIRLHRFKDKKMKLDSTNFYDSISDCKVLVKFEATWCAPCKAYAPTYKEFSEENDNVKCFWLSQKFAQSHVALHINATVDDNFTQAHRTRECSKILKNRSFA